MRQPTRQINSRSLASIPPSSRAWSMEFWEEQPGTATPGGSAPLGTINLVRGEFTDDAGQAVQRRMTVDVANVPDGLDVGMWVTSSIGIREVAPKLYTLPTMMVTEINYAVVAKGKGGSIVCEDPAVVLNQRPYEVDTSLTGTLQSLVADCCAVALSRDTDTSGVPAVPLPAGTLAEFGNGRWDSCLRIAEQLGVQLRFTDEGDVVGLMMSQPPPSPVGDVIPLSPPPGPIRKYQRWPTDAVVLVTRGDAPALTGRANGSSLLPPPAWYRPMVVTERMEGDDTTTQADADEMAWQFLRARWADGAVYDDLAVLPAPWMEAGQDTVNLRDVRDDPAYPISWRFSDWWVRAYTMQLPTLATTVTLRGVIPA